MSRATSDDQLKFLLSCVRHSNNGKIDFVEVAGECGVVSKGAAAKRYERLLKANGINPHGGPTENFSISTPKQKSKAEIAKSAAAKRRKLEGDLFDFKAEDEDEHKPYFKPEPMETDMIKRETDTGFQPYSRYPIAGPPLQPFFPRPPFPYMNMQNSISSPYTPFHPQAPQRHPLPMPRAINTPMPPPTPSPIQHSTQNSPVSIQRQPKDLSQATASVSEEEIQNMFDEFCSQDLFKQSDFGGGNPSSQTSTKDSSSNTIPLVTEAQISPRTIEVPATPLIESQMFPTYIKEEPTTETSSSIAPTPEPTGRAIDDSIVIAD